MTDSRSRSKPPLKASSAVDDESRRIVREDLLTNLLVEAGAGSGKTEMLVQRMAAGVAAGRYQIERMAAVTFTRKAASELRGRFHLALERRLHEIESAGDEQPAGAPQRIRGALSNLERFFAGTIHSFCARLLRERPVESGVSPGFTELDEVQDVELRKRVWRDFVTSTRADGDPGMLALLDAEIRPTDLDQAFATICRNDDVEFPAGEASCPDPKATWKALDKFWKELQKHLPAEVNTESTCKIQRAASDFQGRLSVSRYRLDRPAVIASLLEIWPPRATITQKWWSESATERKRLRDLVNPMYERFHTDVVLPYLSQWRQYVYRLSVTLLTRAREHAGRERRRLNTLNYGDLLVLTARVLRENADVRRSLQQKYRYLFVDEFQDTDPVQAEIIFLLAADESPRAPSSRPADWRTVPLHPGSLFVVGDPKQSIYRFRRADIDIYNIVRARLNDPAVGRVLPLTMNFRSVRPLCTWANQVFATRFPKAPTIHSPQFSALDASPKSGTGGGLFTLTHHCERADVPNKDSARIAAYIRTEVDAGRRRFSDFLILTRKKRNIGIYADALEALNVPIEVSGAGAFGDSEEVGALTAVLRAIADPQDALALIGALRGPFFGVSDRELFAFRQAGGWFSIFAETNGSGPVDTALLTLRQYYRWTRVLPAAAALERMLEHSGYLAIAATSPGGVEAGDLIHAVDRVRQVVEQGGSLSDAADSLEEDFEEINEIESMPLEPGRTDVVRVMNLHKAKGLEANVVFLADPGGGTSIQIDSHIERQGATAFGWFKLEKKSDVSYTTRTLGQHADWPVHERAEQPYLVAEDDRLLYVAATRAREALVVSRWPAGNPKYAAWGVLNDFLTDATELAVSDAASPPAVALLDCSNAAQQAANLSRVAAHDHSRQPSWRMSSVTADTSHIAQMTRSSIADVDDPTRVVRADTPGRRADAGMAWGALIHGLLEHAMRHRAATRDDLTRLAMWLTVEEPHLRASIDDAIETVRRVAQAEFWQNAKAGEHLEETPFMVALDQGVLTNGIVDLLFNTGDGWRIRDYKTDLSLNAAVYEGQLNAYRTALEKMHCDVVDASLIHVRTDQS